MKNIGLIFFIIYSTLSTHSIYQKSYTFAACFAWLAIVNLAYYITESFKEEIKKRDS